MTIAMTEMTPAKTMWRRHLTTLSVVIVAILLLFAREILELVSLWWTSSTYNHCLLILPIIAWLVWQRWPELRILTPRGWLPGLLLVTAGAAGWLMGNAASVSIVQHFALILMLQGAVVAILGPEVSRALMFPLAYMFFLVPAGEGLVAPLQTVTAKICMVLLDLVGVPAHIEGVFITIPNGWFEVAEACSGAKFLIAMGAYSVLAANICFKRWSRRIAFVAAALILPILANGVRAWGTIYVAHLSDVRFASGVDHVVYGWVFFGVVIALLMGLSWRFFDRDASDPWFDATALQAPAGARDAVRHASIGAVLIPLLALAWSAVASAGTKPLPANIALPEVLGWTRISSDAGIWWRPNFKGADRLLVGRYRNARGASVDLAVAIYAGQSEGHELVGFGQGAVAPDSGWAWTDNQPAPPHGRAFRITGPGGIVRDVVTFYRVGNITTGSEFRVKIETLQTKLTGGPRRAVAVIVTAPERATDESARPTIDSFLKALGPVESMADGMAGAN